MLINAANAIEYNSIVIIWITGYEYAKIIVIAVTGDAGGNFIFQAGQMEI
jgi:hypothetical protein